MRILIKTSVVDNTIEMISDKQFPVLLTRELTSITEQESANLYIYKMPLLLYNAYITKNLVAISGGVCKYDNDTSKEIIDSYSSSVTDPIVDLVNDTHISITVPGIKSYHRLLSILNANLVRMQTYTIPISHLYEVYRFLSVWQHPFLPKFFITDKLKEKIVTPITEDDSLQSLFSVQLEDLFTIKNGYKVKTEYFKKLKYDSAVDLLLNRPLRYIDRRETYTFNQLPFNTKAFVKGTIVKFSTSFDKHGFLTLNDGFREVELVLYKQGFLTRYFKEGDEIYVEVSRKGRNGYNAYSITSSDEVNAMPVVPVYKQSKTGNISTKLLTNSVEELLTRFNGENLLKDVFDEGISLWELLNRLHFPKSSDELEDTINKLAFIELVCMQIIFLDKRAKDQIPQGIPKITENPRSFNEFVENLPYDLTTAQKKALNDIRERLVTPHYESMLLSGDTGSGKSTIAVGVCLYTVDSGYQAALAAPTEILAEQLYNGFMKSIQNLTNKPVVAYISSGTKAKEKREIQNMLSNGQINVVIGTHSVMNLNFKNLGLIVIDEEQKFGKKQKETLLYSRTDGKVPDVLSQTATPIPQSTALAFYGDYDLISLSEKPAGRKENITKWIKMSSDEFLQQLTNEVWQHIFSEIELGHQVFIVTPAVAESSKSASVEKTKEIISSKFPHLKVDTVHGKLKKEQQIKKIEKFRANETNVLIASSIIEVGIDIPNSTIMLVLDAYRFGASSLHQIRGRVGRSDLQGYCYLISEATTDNSKRRLQSLVDSNNGFDIALVDLETRKEGDLFGEKQSGESNLRFCDFINHANLVELAQFKAKNLYNSNTREQVLLDANTFLKKGADN